MGVSSRLRVWLVGPASIALTVLLASGGGALATPSVSMGDGRSEVVEYDQQFVPKYRIVGFQKPVDVTSLADGSLLVVDEGVKRVMVLRRDGTTVWSESIVNYPLRARPRARGGFLVTGLNEVVATDDQRAIVWRREVPRVAAAVELANGNVLIAYNTSYGVLEEVTPSGEVRWRSRPLGHVGADGRWVNEDIRQTFTSVHSLDIGRDGSIFTADFDGDELRLLSPEYARTWGAKVIQHPVDTRLGPKGEMIAVSPERYAVWFRIPEQAPRMFTPDLMPWCGSITEDGNLLVGLFWQPEAAAPYASEAKANLAPPRPWWQRGLPVPLLAFAASLLVALGLRWREIAGLRRPAPSGIRTSPTVERATSGTTARTRTLIQLALGAALAVGCALAWQGTVAIEDSGFQASAWAFAFGCVLAGLALRALDSLRGNAATLTDFVPSAWRSPPRRHDLPRTALLSFLAVGALALCCVVLRLRPADEAVAVGAWIAAQVWILGAAFPPVPNDDQQVRSRTIRASMALVIIGSIALRFWQIGYYPDYVHHDHGMFGDEILRAWRGNWTPFFRRGYSVARPWFLPVFALLQLFGPQYWVLRFTAAASGVVAVWATYLLGSILLRPRVGVIAAAMVAANHSLLLYSRQPYVIDPVAPFVLALYAAAVGMKRGCRFHWCASGVLLAWALLAYYASVTYALVGAALIAYVACIYPRALWRARAGISWMIAGAVIVYLPMLITAAESIVVSRANSIIVLLNPDGSIRWDAALWADQVVRSFGSLLRWQAGEYAWGVSAGRSLLLPIGACLFGIGLVYLVTARWTLTTFLLLVWPTICIFFGSAALPSPPTPYHFLAAVIPVLLISAVALDRVLALTDPWPRVWRALSQVAAGAVLIALIATHLEAAWKAVERAAPGSDGEPVYRTDAAVLAARFIREHPRYRYYLVRQRYDVSAPSPLFRFFAADSDLSDLTGSLAGELPVEPAEGVDGVAFLVLPTRQAEGEVIESLYPDAAQIRIHTDRSAVDLLVYLVRNDSVRRAWASAKGANRSLTEPSASP